MYSVISKTLASFSAGGRECYSFILVLSGDGCLLPKKTLGSGVFLLPEHQHLENTELPKPAGSVTSVQVGLISPRASSSAESFAERAIKCSPVGRFTVAGEDVLLGGRVLWNAWSSVAGWAPKGSGVRAGLSVYREALWDYRALSKPRRHSAVSRCLLGSRGPRVASRAIYTGHGR